MTYDGADPIGMEMRRAYYYSQHRSSAIPYLTNVGDESPSAIAFRIEEEHKRPAESTLISRQDWVR